MTTSYDCTSEDQRAKALEHAQRAIADKRCIVIPTDTVYGIAADAFSGQAVTMLLVSKGRGRHMPPPVLIPRMNALDGLATDVPAEARQLAEAFWPGGLTLILHAQPSLDWDLGETKGTVALRMPDDEIALEVLTLTGPLAVSSANRTGQPAARTAAEAYGQLAESVEVYLEGGPRPVGGGESVASTIVDATATPMRVVRDGAISLDRLRSVVPGILGIDEDPGAAAVAGDTDAASENTDAAPADTDAATDPDDGTDAGAIDGSDPAADTDPAAEANSRTS